MSKPELEEAKHVIICSPAVAKYIERNSRDSKRLLHCVFYIPGRGIF